MTTLATVLFAQLQWFGSVWGAANRQPWLGVGLALFICIWHVARAPRRMVELNIIVVAIAAGFALDSALASAGLIQFTSGSVIPGLTTPWMLSLWACFATMLSGPLRPLLSRPSLAIAFGIIGGPLAYWAGTRFGALTFASHWSFAFIALEWAVAMALFAMLIKHLTHACVHRAAS